MHDPRKLREQTDEYRRRLARRGAAEPARRVAASLSGAPRIDGADLVCKQWAHAAPSRKVRRSSAWW